MSSGVEVAQGLKVVDAFDLEDELRTILKPGEMVKDAQGRRHRLPRYFYEIPSHEAALASAHGTVATLSAAGLRLLSLDPFDVTAVLHDLRPAVAAVADSTIGLAGVDDLPHASTPFAEIDVERQSTLPSRLFRS